MDHWKSVKTILDEFDNDKDAALDFEEFREMCIALFDREQVENSESVVRDIFYVFDTDGDHHLNEDELNRCYTDWISVILNPRNVLIVVDVQNDFISGSLALKDCPAKEDGAEVVEPINNLIKKGNWENVIYSLDWHPPNHIGFFENLNLRPLSNESKVKKEDAKVFDTVIFEKPHLEQRLWPVHCVMDTWGAQLHKDLIIANNSEQIRKGKNPEMESYSAFLDNNSENSTELLDKLKEIKATDIYICGLAYDVCVKATCLDGLQLGYRLALIEDCSRGVDPDGIIEARKQIQNDFGLITTSEEALKLVNKKSRSLVMAQQAAAVLAKRYEEKIET